MSLLAAKWCSLLCGFVHHKETSLFVSHSHSLDTLRSLFVECGHAATARIESLSKPALWYMHAEYGLLNQVVPHMLCALYGVPVGVYRLHHCIMHHVVSFLFLAESACEQQALAGSDLTLVKFVKQQDTQKGCNDA